MRTVFFSSHRGRLPAKLGWVASANAGSAATEEAVRQTGVPQYLGAPDDLKLLLMKALNRKTLGHRYQVHDGSRLSFQGRWYTCPGLLSRLQGKEFELYYDRRVRHVGAC